MCKTIGTVEAEIGKALTHWEKDFLGRGSVSVKTDILRDMIIVSLRGILTPAEYSVCNSIEGTLSIKRNRADLVESGTSQLYEIISNIAEENIKSFYTDLSTVTGERIMVFKMEIDLETKWKIN
ncbi:DUF2294 domain-containing protein [Salirhabdus salicampi]|uniref:DUF2294 domain-containing protein n=1 Tax=Salirhabdus salicampi TaxID=476102 RepID=UPI0020C54D38|nr:DUF2294 domain-containing protein [Salirhabdus salicampi]MCP8615812.1 DUF2294 domain-containing protein [Salirhabdus salicampi]